jgi:ATP-dependent 26S proteasome regulatory subunit
MNSLVFSVLSKLNEFTNHLFARTIKRVFLLFFLSFINLGIQPPKGVLLYGPPGTGKTLMARACAAQTKSTFLKLAGPQLVQMFIGDGAKLVRDAFALAKEKSPAIIFIDELDAIGTKRFVWHLCSIFTKVL